MAEIILTLDATEYVKILNIGIEIGFMIAIDGNTTDLDEQLNINRIGDAK